MNIDVHAHMVPTRAVRAAGLGESWNGMKFDVSAGGSITFRSRSGVTYTCNPGYWAPAEQRIENMHRLSIDAELISVSGSFLGYSLDVRDAALAAREINDEISAMCRASPKFVGLGTVPLQDVGRAVAELESIHSLDLFGVVLGANVNGEYWDSPRLFPVLEAASELGQFILMHPDPFTYDRHVAAYRVGDVIGHQTQLTFAVASLIFGGVLDRLPDLRVCVAQGGGYAAIVGGRLDHAYALWRDQQIVAGLPSSYLSRLYYDSLVYGPAALRTLAEAVGADRILLGSDRPSSVCMPDPVSWVHGCALEESDESAILGRNMEKLLKDRRS